MISPVFEIGNGPDTLLPRYDPESILALANTIKAARAMGLPDPDGKELQTELEGTFIRRAPA
jgi:hypothetical protein